MREGEGTLTLYASSIFLTTSGSTPLDNADLTELTAEEAAEVAAEVAEEAVDDCKEQSKGREEDSRSSCILSRGSSSRRPRRPPR